jgi:MFS family permease
LAAVRRRSPLRQNTDFRRLWIGEVASTLGTRLSAVAYPLLVLALTGSPAKAGLVGFLRTLPYFLLALPVGVLADRHDRRRLILVADAIGFAAVGSVAVAAAAGTLTFEQVAVVAFVEGSAGLVARTALTASLPRLVAREQLPEAVAVNSARESGAALAGPLLGGVLFGLSRALPFAVDASSYVVSAIAAGTIRRPLQDERTGLHDRLLPALRTGLAWIWREPFLRTSELLVAGGNFATNAVSLTLVLVAKHQGASAALVGVMLAVASAGGLLGAIAAPRLQRSVSRRAIVVGYSWLGVAVLGALLTMPPPLVLGILYGVWLFFGPLWDALVVGYRLAIVPDQLQGRVESTGILISFGGAAIGPLAAGTLFDAVGGRGTFAALACWMLVLALVGSASRALRI